MADVLVDAGPLIALLSERDREHQACRQAFSRIGSEVWTVWPAVTEACHFLAKQLSRGPGLLLELIENGDLGVVPIDEADIPRMRELMTKYADLPMDLADAALVRAAEREGIDTIFTLDKRDFRVYRPRHVRQFRILP